MQALELPCQEVFVFCTATRIIWICVCEVVLVLHLLVLVLVLPERVLVLKVSDVESRDRCDVLCLRPRARCLSFPTTLVHHDAKKCKHKRKQHNPTDESKAKQSKAKVWCRVQIMNHHHWSPTTHRSVSNER